MNELDQLRLDYQRLMYLIEQSHYVISELIDGSREINVERCKGLVIKAALEETMRNDKNGVHPVAGIY